VEYISPEKVPYFMDCEPLVKGFGFSIVELTAFKRQSTWHIRMVIAGPEGVGIADCTRVHRALLPRLEALLSSQDMYVEVMSPGLDRIIKNGFEFTVFTGKLVKVWNTDISDWMHGIISSCDSKALRLSTPSGDIEIPFDKIAKAKLVSPA